MLAGPSAGVRVSNDAGQTWREHIVGLGDARVFGLSASAGGLVFAATSAGVFSCDVTQGDDPWRPRTSTPVGTRAVACSNLRVVAACEDGQVLVSDDSGVAWRALTTPFRGETVLGLAAAGNSDALFAATSVSSETVLWRSADGGVTWQRWLVERGPRAAVSIAVSPNYPVDELVLVGLDSTILRPSRGAEEVRNRERRPLWLRKKLAPASPRITSMAMSDDARDVFVATSAGVFASRDQGRTFAEWSQGLDERPILAVAVSPVPQFREVFALELGGQLWRRSIA
jgi:photosystem II stability/assembly factor-like uncharacterized protein